MVQQSINLRYVQPCVLGNGIPSTLLLKMFYFSDFRAAQQTLVVVLYSPAFNAGEKVAHVICVGVFVRCAAFVTHLRPSLSNLVNPAHLKIHLSESTLGAR